MKKKKMNISSYFDVGGTVELEGSELIETPSGEQKVLSGPSHEDGGIDFLLSASDAPLTADSIPIGSKVFTNSVKVYNTDGKLEGMKTRKQRRDKALKEANNKLTKVKELFDKDPIDINKSTFENQHAVVKELATNNLIEEQADLAFMNTLNNSEETKGKGGVIKEYANGGIIDPKTALTIASYFNPNLPSISDIVTPTGNRSDFTGIGIDDPSVDLGDDGLSPAPINGQDPTPPVSGTPDLSLGDKLGFAGLAGNVIQPAITLAQQAFDEPNINRFFDVGRNANNAIDEAIDNADNTLQVGLTELELDSNTQRASNRANARTANDLTTRDLATFQAKENALAKITSTYIDKLIGLGGSKANINLRADTLSAQGATQRDDNNKRDLDNFFSNFSQNIADVATSLTTAGVNLNELDYNEDFLDMLSKLTRNNIGVKRNTDGKLELTNG